MKLDINTIADYKLSDNCIIEYFCTLYEMIPSFHISGEKILQQNGYRSRAWVESMFEVAADNHCFVTLNCPKGLPFWAIQPFISQDMVADFCLANDILEAAFYEYQLFQQYQKLNCLQLELAKQAVKNLRTAKRKFRKCKMEYISLAYGPKPADKIVSIYDACVTIPGNKMQQNIIAALELMPVFYQLCPRDENAVDTIPIRKLYYRYKRLFNICAEFEDLHQV